jgi:hypothetical protein
MLKRKVMRSRRTNTKKIPEFFKFAVLWLKSQCQKYWRSARDAKD